MEIYNQYSKRNISFENQNGDVFFITSEELRQELGKFIDN